MYAGRDGVVEQVISTCPNMFANQKECGGGYGNYITIKHATGVYSRYAHLNSVDVKKWSKSISWTKNWNNWDIRSSRSCSFTF